MQFSFIFFLGGRSGVLLALDSFLGCFLVFSLSDCNMSWVGRQLSQIKYLRFSHV